MKKLILGLLLVGGLAAGGGAYYNLRRQPPEPQISTAVVTRGTIIDTVGATGSVAAVTTVQVGTQVSGTILELHADFNSIVRKGQIIARLDPSLFATQIDQARANLTRAEAEVERLRVSLEDARTKLARAEGLAARQLIPLTELETAQVNVKSTEAQIRSSVAQVTQAQATLNQNEVNLQHTVIAAPIDGIVMSRNVDVGQTVAASMQAPILFLLAADLTKMQVNASIDEADVGRIRPKQVVRFRVDAYPAEEFVGSVSQVRLQPVVVQNVVTYETVIDVPNPSLKLKPGMTANVTIEIARRDDVLRIPNAALRFRATPDIFAALGQELPPELQQGAAPARFAAGGQPDATAEATGGQGPTGAPRATAAAGAAPAPSAEAAPAEPRSGRGQPPAAAADARPAGRDGAPGGGQPRFERATAPGGGDTGSGAPDADRRREFAERLQNMSPEEREQMMQRRRARGSDAPADGDAGAGPPARGSSAAPRRPAATISAGAQTIDSLFGPLPPTTSAGRVWMMVGGKLKATRVRLGITDGSHTALLDGDIEERAELVTAVLTGTDPAVPSGSGRSPLMGPDRGGRNMGGVRNPGPPR